MLRITYFRKHGQLIASSAPRSSASGSALKPVSSSLRLSFQNDTPSPRFPPWTVDEYRGISYVVRDANNFAVTYVYFESGPS